MSIDKVAFPVSGLTVRTRTGTIKTGPQAGKKFRRHYLEGFMSDGTPTKVPVTAAMAERFRRAGIMAVTGKGELRRRPIKQKKRKPKKKQ